MLKLSLTIFVFCTQSIAGPYSKHTTDLRSIENKINAHKVRIKNYVIKKNTTKDKEELFKLLEGIKTSHIDLKEDKAYLEELKHHVDYEHPKKGKDFKIRYEKADFKGLSEYEVSSGLKLKLDESISKIKTVYNPDEVEVKTETGKHKCEGDMCRNKSGKQIKKTKKIKKEKPVKLSK